MNRWQEQLANHPIHETLSELLRLAESKHEPADADREVERRRFIKILNLIEDKVAGMDADTAPLPLIDTINTTLRQPQIWNELTQFSGNGNVGHLKNANNDLQGHLRSLHWLPSSKQGGAVKQTKALEKQFDQFVEAVDNEKKALATSLAALDDERSKLQGKLDELSAAADQRRAETDQLLSGWQSQFSEAQSERARMFEESRSKALADFSTQATQILQERDASLKKRDQEFAKEIQRLTQDAREKHKGILELHEIVAGDSVAAGYLQNAAAEKKQANFWRWASIVFIVATATWTIVSYWRVPSTDPTDLAYWGQALKALSVAGVLLFGAVYSAKQSNLHRHNEQKTRWLALEVKAIDPFIASLSPAEQKELKKALSEKLFGQMNAPDGPGDDAINEHALEAVLKSIVEVVKAARA